MIIKKEGNIRHAFAFVVIRQDGYDVGCEQVRQFDALSKLRSIEEPVSARCHSWRTLVSLNDGRNLGPGIAVRVL